MGDLHVSNKIDENSDMKICNNNQNFKGPYIARYKISVQDLFSLLKALGIKGTRFTYIYTCLIKIIEFCGYQSFQT